MGVFLLNVKNYIKMITSKKSATLSGALVFFILVGVVPITYIASLIFSFFGSEIKIISNFFSYKEFVYVSNYVIETAGKMGAKGNIFVFGIALFSSANFFYHLKLSGELIYNFKSKNKIFVRITSIVITFFAITILSLALVVYIAITPILNKIVGGTYSVIINGLISFGFVLVIAILVNFYACPYKLKFREVIKGSIYTTLFSFLATFGFFIYIKYFARYDEIYGQVATIIIFLTYLYLIINGFLQGVTLNVYLMGKTNREKRVKKYNFRKVK